MVLVIRYVGSISFVIIAQASLDSTFIFYQVERRCGEVEKFATALIDLIKSPFEAFQRTRCIINDLRSLLLIINNI